ncbi:TrmH family RNA methyltransferase [Planctomicrobium piriforme]|uniref:TrmH family RNA methyltransferase n=1 Tax=Planctomicrobium piriforme TaxID=1576369 RepID=UPI001C31444A|nr:RNA methyltransferase [Planctomicrobium piriforme]
MAAVTLRIANFSIKVAAVSPSSPFTDAALAEALQEFLTPHRRERFAQVLQARTRWLRVVLVDLFQQHNASAVLRTCDALGVQHVHAVETRNDFETNPDISLGSEQWLALHHHDGPAALQDCVTQLKSQGFRIAATVLHADSRPIQELPLDQPVALLFGTEKEGLSPEAVAAADVLVHLPMYGFVESYNVSVAAALSLQSITDRLRQSDLPWQLDEAEHTALLLQWSRLSIRNVEIIERRLRAEHSAKNI